MCFKLEFKVLFDGKNLTEICDKRRGFYCWVNTLNGKRYVGMAAGVDGFYSRVRNEVYGFRNNKHHGTPLLFSAVRKYGLASFRVVELMEFSGEAVCFGEVEKALIRSLGALSPAGYNMTEGGSGTLGRSSLEASRKKRGKPNPAAATRLAKRFVLLSPTGEKHYVTNLAAFTRALKFPENSLYQVVSGRSISYRGWASATRDPKAYARSLSSVAYFVSPEGKTVKVINIAKFSKAIGAQQAAMNHVWRGKKHYHTCQGWRKASQPEIDAFSVSHGSFWDFDHWSVPL